LTLSLGNLSHLDSARSRNALWSKNARYAQKSMEDVNRKKEITARQTSHATKRQVNLGEEELLCECRLLLHWLLHVRPAV